MRRGAELQNDQEGIIYEYIAVGLSNDPASALFGIKQHKECKARDLHVMELSHLSPHTIFGTHKVMWLVEECF